MCSVGGAVSWYRVQVTLDWSWYRSYCNLFDTESLYVGYFISFYTAKHGDSDYNVGAVLNQRVSANMQNRNFIQ